MTERAWHLLGAALLVTAAVAITWLGQPDADSKWRMLAPRLEPMLENRSVVIEPAELLTLMHNNYIDLRLIDVRTESDWNRFHLWGALHAPLHALAQHTGSLSDLPDNGVIVFVSNDETAATLAWKRTMATAMQPNAYILAGGINRWLNEFASPPGESEPGPDGTLRAYSGWALGARHPAALPDLHATEDRTLQPKVRLQKRVVRKGGCG
ncbi:MAG: rhodanese-like domain-containing protein [Gammaproteobacteria bacterium]|nr:rhodanese-like domain-containing protein [Gammaproteobacteria bacterium]